MHPHTHHLSTIINLLRLRKQHNTTILLQLGEPTEENLEAIKALPESQFMALISPIADAYLAEMALLTENSFPGFFCGNTDGPSEGEQLQ